MNRRSTATTLVLLAFLALANGERQPVGTVVVLNQTLESNCSPEDLLAVKVAVLNAVKAVNGTMEVPATSDPAIVNLTVPGNAQSLGKPNSASTGNAGNNKHAGNDKNSGHPSQFPKNNKHVNKNIASATHSGSVSNNNHAATEVGNNSHASQFTSSDHVVNNAANKNNNKNKNKQAVLGSSNDRRQLMGYKYTANEACANLCRSFEGFTCFWYYPACLRGGQDKRRRHLRKQQQHQLLLAENQSTAVAGRRKLWILEEHEQEFDEHLASLGLIRLPENELLADFVGWMYRWCGEVIRKKIEADVRVALEIGPSKTCADSALDHGYHIYCVTPEKE